MLVSSAIASNYFIFCWPALIAFNFYESEFFSIDLCPEYWTFIITAFFEHSGLTSSNIQWFILVVQGIFNPLPTLVFQGIGISWLVLPNGPVLRYTFYNWEYLDFTQYIFLKWPLFISIFYFFSLFLVLQCCPESLASAWS